MFLINLDRMTRKIGFRLAAWYSGLILASIVVLFLIAYFFMAATLESRDFQEIQSELSEIESEYMSGGVEGIKAFVGSHLSARLKNLLFIRIADTNNKTVYMYCPFSEDRFPIATLSGRELIDLKWLRLETWDQGYDTLDILTRVLSKAHILQIGMTSQLREKDLHHFRQLILTWMIPLILTGIIFGVFMSMRTLMPLRHIISTVQAIDIGKMDSRVPRTGTDDELDELARLFNNMLDRISNLILGMKQSLDNVAHDLRTPLTRMRNKCESVLVTLPENDPGRESHEGVLEESDRILRMLDTLMDVSEAETGVMSLSKQAINLKDLIFPIVDMYEVLAESKKVALTMDIPGDLVLQADPDRIGQAVANLLDNALKFTPSRGRVHIEAFHQGKTIVIRIHDTGPGIPARDLDRIWDRLYRVDQSRSQKGLGLGLSLVKAFVQAHNGTVTVFSNAEKGSVFSVNLPIPPES